MGFFKRFWSADRPTVIRNKYTLGTLIGSGAFGEVYSGTDKETNEEVGIKLQKRKSGFHQLWVESELYAMLEGGIGVPKMRWFGVEGNYNALVLDLLGPSLEDLFEYCNRKFSLKTVLGLAVQLIERVEHVHSKCFLHRDIKPGNFVMGRGDLRSRVFIIDFGLAKKYDEPSSDAPCIIPYRENNDLIGSPRFSSINIHLGIDQSRRDDLESLGYMFLYFLEGRLPWQGLTAGTKEEKYEKIRRMKTSRAVEALCKSHPCEFVSYFRYCWSLRFGDKPDYGYLKRIFRELFLREGFQYDSLFDWDKVQQSEVTHSCAPPRYKSVCVSEIETETSSCGASKRAGNQLAKRQQLQLQTGLQLSRNVHI